MLYCTKKKKDRLLNVYYANLTIWNKGSIDPKRAVDIHGAVCLVLVLGGGSLLPTSRQGSPQHTDAFWPISRKVLPIERSLLGHPPTFNRGGSKDSVSAPVSGGTFQLSRKTALLRGTFPQAHSENLLRSKPNGGPLIASDIKLVSPRGKPISYSIRCPKDIFLTHHWSKEETTFSFYVTASDRKRSWILPFSAG